MREPRRFCPGTPVDHHHRAPRPAESCRAMQGDIDFPTGPGTPHQVDTKILRPSSLIINQSLSLR